MDSKNKKLLIFFLEIIILISLNFWLLYFYQNDLSTSGTLELKKIPLDIAGWKGKEVPLPPDHPTRVGGVKAIYLSYLKNKKKVDLYIVESKPGSLSLHPPEYCLIGGQSKEVDRSLISIPWQGGTLQINRFVARRDWRNSLVYYWYFTGQDYTPSYAQQQLVGLKNKLTGKEQPLAMVRLSWDGDEEASSMEKVFRAFIVETFPQINAYLKPPED